MKQIIFLLFIGIATNALAQNSDYIVSTDGIGPIKLGMSQAEVEQVLNKKIPLTNPWDTISGSWQDSAKVRFRNINVQLDFQRSYFAPDTFRMIVIAIRANSPLCKTRAGIGIGTDKLKIIAAYEDYVLTILPWFTNYYDTEKSKTKSTININSDSADHVMRFFLLNKKVVGFEVSRVFSDSE